MSSRPEDVEFQEMSADEERELLDQQHRRNRVWLVVMLVVMAGLMALSIYYVMNVGLVESGIRRTH